jgi:hypothetical protein
MSEELTVLFRQSVHHLFNAARQFSILSFCRLSPRWCSFFY